MYLDNKPIDRYIVYKTCETMIKWCCSMTSRHGRYHCTFPQPTVGCTECEAIVEPADAPSKEISGAQRIGCLFQAYVHARDQYYHTDC